jgi:hypothetical protein
MEKKVRVDGKIVPMDGKINYGKKVRDMEKR